MWSVASDDYLAPNGSTLKLKSEYHKSAQIAGINQDCFRQPRTHGSFYLPMAH